MVGGGGGGVGCGGVRGTAAPARCRAGVDDDAVTVGAGPASQGGDCDAAARSVGLAAADRAVRIVSTVRTRVACAVSGRCQCQQPSRRRCRTRGRDRAGRTIATTAARSAQRLASPGTYHDHAHINGTISSRTPSQGHCGECRDLGAREPVNPHRGSRHIPIGRDVGSPGDGGTARLGALVWPPADSGWLRRCRWPAWPAAQR